MWFYLEVQKKNHKDLNSNCVVIIIILELKHLSHFNFIHSVRLKVRVILAV